MMKIKVLIIGGGSSARRYVESLFWQDDIAITICGMGILNYSYELSKNYGLNFINFSNLSNININDFSCIIVTLPPEVKRKYVSFIIEKLKYTNALILEKPLCISLNDLEYYKSLLRNVRSCSVVCQRDFDLETYKIQQERNYNIFFPTFTSDTDFNMIHMLPHVLSWLYTTKCEPICLERSGTNKYIGNWGESPLFIEFVNNSISNNVIINNSIYPKVQFRELNNKILRRIINYEQKDSTLDLKKAFYISSIIINILNDYKKGSVLYDINGFKKL